jgi:cell division protein FtsQ
MAQIKVKDRSWKIWVSALAWCALCLSAAAATRKVQAYIASDPQFTLSPDRRDAIVVSGIVDASRLHVARVFAQDLGRSISLIPLAERRRRLLAIDWVEDASVSRIWPDRILVRIKERKPVAFANLPVSESGRNARLALVDADGVFLEPPVGPTFTFPILEGLSDQQTEEGRRRRVHAMQRLLEDLGPLAKMVSEVNAGSTDDLKIIAQVEDRALELDLGEGNYARRLQNFLNHYPEIRKKTPNATSFNLRLEDQIITKE